MCGYACYAGSRGRDAKVSQRPRPFGLMPQHCAAFQPLPACCPACTEGQPDVNVRKLSQAIPFCRLLGSCLPKSSKLKGVCAKRELGYRLAFYYYYFFFYHVLVACKHGENAFFLTTYFSVPLPLHSLSLQIKTHEQYFSGPYTST